MPLNGEYVPSPMDFVSNQVAEFEASDGQRANVNHGGKPVIILTTVGATSGKLRKVPAMRVKHGDEYAVVPSAGGAPKPPAWYYNLLANPVVELQDGAEKKEYTARQVSGEEKDRWWQRCTEVWPDYDEYQEKVEREIPVFVLTPR